MGLEGLSFAAPRQSWQFFSPVDAKARVENFNDNTMKEEAMKLMLLWQRGRLDSTAAVAFTVVDMLKAENWRIPAEATTLWLLGVAVF
ncbi:hypothetical protein AXG93_203s1090 [Marchantia polymorpha subsp. ruderalis]|uniref:Uncharacterized protein n=1 Tax=Marchantia polymorpha subsp. ruderalis TaxID=1480154 RepID=A0A176VLF7_MARPO|nr:hypothetical protein AXG93_203s1090 [Marchantia polymorpha subsp. ruderalis]